MQLKDIALKNLQRRKSKMLFMVLGMVFGIATIVTLFTLTNAMEDSVNRKIEEAGIKVALVPRTDTASFSVGGIPIVSGISYNVNDLPADAVDKVKSIPDASNIKVIAPKVMGTVSVEGHKALLVGVDFPSELKIKPWWDVYGNLPENQRQALIGSKVAKKLKVEKGEVIQVNDQELMVSGILRPTGEDEDGIIFVSIDSAQEMLGKLGKYSFIHITTVKDEVIADKISAELSDKLPEVKVSIVKHASEARQELVERFSKFSLIVSLLMVVIAALIITSTMMASVNERVREIGIFRAIGFRKAHITKIILIEAGVVSGISAFAGYFLGMAAAYWIAPLFADFKMVVTWNPLVGAAVFTGAVILGLLAGLLPASNAAKLDPAESLRFI